MTTRTLFRTVRCDSMNGKKTVLGKGPAGKYLVWAPRSRLRFCIMREKQAMALAAQSNLFFFCDDLVFSCS